MPFNRKFLSAPIESGISKAASSVDKQKLFKEYFHRGYPYAAIVSLLEKSYGVRIPVRMLKRKLKNRPKTFTLITCPPFNILNFIYARKASQILMRKLCKI